MAAFQGRSSNAQARFAMLELQRKTVSVYRRLRSEKEEAQTGMMKV